MPFVEHPNFELPHNPDSTIWRYLTLAKLVDTLESSHLFFPRADQLGDPLEGSLPHLNRALRTEQLLTELPDPQMAPTLAYFISRSNEDARYRVAVSCWRLDEHESVAMWKLYSSEVEGVAIKSTVKRFCESMSNAPQEVQVGLVRYIDYDSELVSEGNLFTPFLHKRRSFDYERELRAAVLFPPIVGEPLQTTAEGQFMRIPDELGISIPVDLPTLLSSIVVSPAAPDWFFRVVSSSVERIVPGLPVTRSSMSGPALY